MKFEIPFGKEKINITVPDKNVVIMRCAENKAGKSKSENEIIKDALNNCISSKKLSEEAAGK